MILLNIIHNLGTNILCLILFFISTHPAKSLGPRRLNFLTNYGTSYDLPWNHRKFNQNKNRIPAGYPRTYAETSAHLHSWPYPQSSKIRITNNQNDVIINEKLLLDTARTYRSKLRLDDFMLDIFVEDEDTMRKINREHLGRDKPTDIISLRDDIAYTKADYHLNRSPFKPREHYHLGEIFLCPKYIQSMASAEAQSEFKTTEQLLQNKKRGGVAARIEGMRDLNTRMCFILAHGILHLLGYDHETEEDFVEMATMEDELLDRLVEEIIRKGG